MYRAGSKVIVSYCQEPTGRLQIPAVCKDMLSITDPATSVPEFSNWLIYWLCNLGRLLSPLCLSFSTCKMSLFWPPSLQDVYKELLSHYQESSGRSAQSVMSIVKLVAVKKRHQLFIRQRFYMHWYSYRTLVTRCHPVAWTSELLSPCCKD